MDVSSLSTDGLIYLVRENLVALQEVSEVFDKPHAFEKETLNQRLSEIVDSLEELIKRKVPYHLNMDEMVGRGKLRPEIRDMLRARFESIGITSKYTPKNQPKKRRRGRK